MRMNQAIHATPSFRVLSIDQIEMIYSAALEIMQRTGARVFHEEGVEILRKGGAVISDGNLVKVPPSMVKQALASCPGRITLSGRNGNRSIHLQNNEVYFGTGSDCPYIYDADTGKRRRYTRRDVEDAARLADALEQIDFFMSVGLVSDVPHHQTYDRHQFMAMVTNITKPLVLTAVDGRGLSDLHDMACRIRGGEEELRLNPLFAIYIEPTSPLKHTRTAVEKLLFGAEKHIPIIYTPCPSAGGTAPATLAAMLAQDLAETLLGLVMAQVKNPGTPIIMGGVQTIMDLRTSAYSYGAPELSLASAASTDISRWLGLPMFSTGGCSDAKVVDAQAAAEATTSLFSAMLSGASLIHDVGYLDSGLNGSYEMLVLCDEIIAMLKRIGRGISVDPDTLGVDVIHQVGPGGQFLSCEHTFQHFRTEHWAPGLIDRFDYESWKARGSLRIEDRVRERVRKILAEHHPEPMSEKLTDELKAIVDRADKEQERSTV
ncbi:MAG: trimethylamine methyltransferase family protein [Deltaproteobacteria bacterium]|nr:trimethylamine methyltransferase family protein [Deltaproteobacteria bacterium]